MDKYQFMEYLKFIKELFPRANIPTGKEAIGAWYKGFANTNIEIAKDMARMYLQEEQHSFNYAKLLQYKSKAMAGKSIFDVNRTKYECKLCNGEGVVIVENLIEKHIYKYAYRCTCKNSQYQMSYPELTQELIKDKVLVNGTFKVVRAS